MNKSLLVEIIKEMILEIGFYGDPTIKYDAKKYNDSQNVEAFQKSISSGKRSIRFKTCADQAAKELEEEIKNKISTAAARSFGQEIGNIFEQNSPSLMNDLKSKDHLDFSSYLKISGYHFAMILERLLDEIKVSVEVDRTKSSGGIASSEFISVSFPDILSTNTADLLSDVNIENDGIRKTINFHQEKEIERIRNKFLNLKQSLLTPKNQESFTAFIGYLFNEFKGEYQRDDKDFYGKGTGSNVGLFINDIMLGGLVNLSDNYKMFASDADSEAIEYLKKYGLLAGAGIADVADIILTFGGADALSAKFSGKSFIKQLPKSFLRGSIILLILIVIVNMLKVSFEYNYHKRLVTSVTGALENVFSLIFKNLSSDKNLKILSKSISSWDLDALNRIIDTNIDSIIGEIEKEVLDSIEGETAGITNTQAISYSLPMSFYGGMGMSGTTSPYYSKEKYKLNPDPEYSQYEEFLDEWKEWVDGNPQYWHNYSDERVKDKSFSPRQAALLLNMFGSVKEKDESRVPNRFRTETFLKNVIKFVIVSSMSDLLASHENINKAKKIISATFKNVGNSYENIKYQPSGNCNHLNDRLINKKITGKDDIVKQYPVTILK